MVIHQILLWPRLAPSVTFWAVSKAENLKNPSNEKLSVAAKICIRTVKTDSQYLLEKYEYGSYSDPASWFKNEIIDDPQEDRSGLPTRFRTQLRSGRRGRNYLKLMTARSESCSIGEMLRSLTYGVWLPVRACDLESKKAGSVQRAGELLVIVLRGRTSQSLEGPRQVCAEADDLLARRGSFRNCDTTGRSSGLLGGFLTDVQAQWFPRKTDKKADPEPVAVQWKKEEIQSLQEVSIM
eukprot:768279-Hanusia_phi.AAC.3